MSRPHINLYISTSPNGQITGKYGTKTSQKAFKDLGFSDDPNVGFNFDGWIYGRNTATWFSKGKKPDLNLTATVPDGDYIINQGQNATTFPSITMAMSVGQPTQPNMANKPPRSSR